MNISGFLEFSSATNNLRSFQLFKSEDNRTDDASNHGLKAHDLIYLIAMKFLFFVCLLFPLMAFSHARHKKTVETKGYEHIDPHHIVPTEPLTMALDFFDQNKGAINNKNILTIVDFSQHNLAERMYLIDMISGSVATYLVSHGKSSDPNLDGWATLFSNITSSYMSSLGFYLTDHKPYYGEHGLSLRLIGLETTNNNAYTRAIVIHGANYVNDQRKDRLGNSTGCFALEKNLVGGFVRISAGGSLLFAYTKPEMIQNPQQNIDYLKKFKSQPMID